LEKLHFKIGLAGTYWDKRPKYSILFNDQVVVPVTQLDTKSYDQHSDIFYIEFDQEVQEGSSCKLGIRLENKTDSDTVENEDKTAIVKDMLLNICCIEVDEINLGDLLYKKAIFTGDDPNRPVLDKCQDLGWNGTWVLEFESPFYIWLLENI
jgi:hypothetical protein